MDRPNRPKKAEGSLIVKQIEKPSPTKMDKMKLAYAISTPEMIFAQKIKSLKVRKPRE